MKKIILIVGFFLVGALVYRYMIPNDLPVTTMIKQDASGNSSVDNANKWFSVKTNEPSVKAGQSSEKSDAVKIALQFGQTRNLRAFVAVAKTKASDGGLFLSKNALVECLKLPLNKEIETSPALKYDPSESNLLAADRQKALLFIQERCYGFSPDEAKAELDKIKNDPGVALDPLQQLNKKLSSAKDDEQRKLISAEVFNSQNPVLIETWGMTSTLSNSLNDGKEPTEKDRNIYGLAWRLAGCDLGLSCDEQDIEVQSSCYYFDICEKNKIDMLKKMASIDKGNDINFNDVVVMKDKIVNAVKAKRSDVFFH
ncbi:hypothetical protein ACO0K0_05600 [Undibacterium sp. SXout11W]|uniref:hypothetical protein n=1 Tax=Undibacterium sp. SXout11W TaxID=3413050 RepID=UPI003BF244E3